MVPSLGAMGSPIDWPVAMSQSWTVLEVAKAIVVPSGLSAAVGSESAGPAHGRDVEGRSGLSGRVPGQHVAG